MHAKPIQNCCCKPQIPLITFWLFSLILKHANACAYNILKDQGQKMKTIKEIVACSGNSCLVLPASVLQTVYSANCDHLRESQGRQKGKKTCSKKPQWALPSFTVLVAKSGSVMLEDQAGQAKQHQRKSCSGNARLILPASMLQTAHSASSDSLLDDQEGWKKRKPLSKGFHEFVPAFAMIMC